MCSESGEGLAAGAPDPDEQGVAAGLLDHPGDTTHVLDGEPTIARYAVTTQTLKRLVINTLCINFLTDRATTHPTSFYFCKL